MPKFFDRLFEESGHVLSILGTTIHAAGEVEFPVAPQLLKQFGDCRFVARRGIAHLHAHRAGVRSGLEAFVADGAPRGPFSCPPSVFHFQSSQSPECDDEEIAGCFR